MMMPPPTFSVPTSPAGPCYPQQQYFVAPHSHTQPHYSPPPSDAYAQFHQSSSATQQPLYSPDPSAQHSAFVYPTTMPAPTTAISSAQSTPALESGEWTRSPFEGYTSSVPSLYTDEAAAGNGRKHAEVVGRRQRISMACSYCRRRKIRCDGAEVCASCSRSGRVCEYTPVPVDESKPVRVRRVPLSGDDKRKMPPSPAAGPHSAVYPHQQPAAGHPYISNTYSIHGYSPSAPVGQPMSTYGGYASIPAWSSGVMGPPPPHVHQSASQYQEPVQPVTPLSKPFPSVLVAPSSSAESPSSANEPCSCGGHSSAHSHHSGRSSVSSSISPPHTPIRQSVPQFAPQPHSVGDLAHSPYYNSYPSYAYPSSGPLAASSRPPLANNQYYLPYTPATPFVAGQQDDFKPQLLFQPAPFVGTTTTHAGLVGLGITMPQGAVGLFDGMAEPLPYAA